ncbi:hypothetical protein EDC94DRAFT_488879, partial [Helicostylum pulchrum]
YIPVFFFLVIIFPKYDYKGPYILIEKNFIHINLKKVYDCLAFDGGYYYYIDKFLENCDKKGNDKINNSNFMFPIRKKINEDLTEDEILYNETFGSFRSKIEGCFGHLRNKFKRYNNNEGSCKITDIKLYNIQLKLSLLLLNIQRFCSLYSIPLKPNHLLWANDNFNYP